MTHVAERLYRVCMYTSGSGSGHLSRVNAVYKGFQRAGIESEFFVVAPRTRYAHLLTTGVARVAPRDVPEFVDIFICDWQADEFVRSLVPARAGLWVGLARLGTIPRRFPRHFYLIGLEPGVKAHASIWPIISTWPDEILSREEARVILGVEPDRRVALLCENGCFAKHLGPVLDSTAPVGMVRIECSNSPHAADRAGCRDIYPIAPFFAAIDHLVIGAGYNAVHEVRCYLRTATVELIRVGGDDQAARLERQALWPSREGSRAHELAHHLVSVLQDRGSGSGLG
jgi:hypothetical protein